MTHAYKKVAAKVEPQRIKQYHPAAAVRARGDRWTFGREVWNISPETLCDLRHVTQDHWEFLNMVDMERGKMARV